MDPTHRLLLETAWQALEHANIIPTELYNTEMGVFMALHLNPTTPPYISTLHLHTTPPP
ncbi:MAG: beta-ketoacyl synthase N-terminal-like domain-containing protein [Pseudomonadota bacterium]